MSFKKNLKQSGIRTTKTQNDCKTQKQIADNKAKKAGSKHKNKPFN